MISDASVQGEPVCQDRAAARKAPRQSRADKTPPARAMSAAMSASSCPASPARLTLAEVEVYSDGKNIARRGRRRNRAPPTAATPAAPSTATRAAILPTAARRTPPRSPPIPGGKSISARNSPSNRSSSSTAPMAVSAAGSITSRSRFSTPAKTKSTSSPNSPLRPSRPTSLSAARDPAILVRRAAMTALTTVRGQETKTFQTLAKFVKEDNDRLAAIQAIQRIPKQYWPKDEVEPLVDQLMLEHIRKIPAKDRTSPGRARRPRIRRSACQPRCRPTQAKKVRVELGELGVRVIRIGTLPERMSYRQGSDRRAEGQGGRVHLREHRFDAAQHRLRQAGLAGGAGQVRGGEFAGPGIRSCASSCRTPTRCCWRARCCSRARCRS